MHYNNFKKCSTSADSLSIAKKYISSNINSILKKIKNGWIRIWNRKSSQKVVTREGRNVKNSQIFEKFSRTGGKLDKIWIFNENLKIAIAVTRREKILRRFRSDQASQIKLNFYMTNVFLPHKILAHWLTGIVWRKSFFQILEKYRKMLRKLSFKKLKVKIEI